MMSAWDVGSKSIVTIKPGDAEALRPACRSGRLICPIEGCPEPAITTRRTYVNRWGTVVVDGFRHLVAPVDDTHAPESLRHIDCKEAVASWLRDLGFSHVRTERVVWTWHGRPGRGRETRSRRPDVAGRHPSGRSVAVEVQVSPISEPEWRARTADLSKGGGATLWLWCWDTNDRRHAVTTALRASVEGGSEAWFLDPRGPGGPMLGWAHQTTTIADEEFKVRPFELSRPLAFEWIPLSRAGVSELGTIEWTRDPAEEVRLANARARQSEVDEKGRRARAEEARKIERRRRETKERSRAAAERANATRRERQAAHRTLSDPSLAAKLPPDIEEACCHENRRDYLIWTPVDVWKRGAATFLLDPGRGSEGVPVADLVDWIERAFPCQRGTTSPAVAEFLRDLHGVEGVRVVGAVVTTSG